MSVTSLLAASAGSVTGACMFNSSQERAPKGEPRYDMVEIRFLPEAISIRL